jgi:hypothetical protein
MGCLPPDPNTAVAYRLRDKEVWGGVVGHGTTSAATYMHSARLSALRRVMRASSHPARDMPSTRVHCKGSSVVSPTQAATKRAVYLQWQTRVKGRGVGRQDDDRK